jgi:hypothetical protein
MAPDHQRSRTAEASPLRLGLLVKLIGSKED